MVVLATSCLSVLSSVLVLSIHHQRGPPSRAPTWLRKLCFRVIAPLICLRRQKDVLQPGKIVMSTERPKLSTFDRRESKFRQGSKISSGEVYVRDRTSDTSASATIDTQDRTRVGLCNLTGYASGQQQPDVYCARQQRLKASYTPLQQQRDCTLQKLKSYNSSYQDKIVSENSEPAFSDSSFIEYTTSSATYSCSNNEEPSRGDALEDSATRGGSRASPTYSLVVSYLINLIQTRQEVEIRDEEIFKEWHDVAFVLDRLLFYLFFLITLLSTVCILEMRPPVQTI